MVYKALLWTDVFWVSYIKWYKFYNNDLSAVLGRKQGGTLKFVNPKHKDWALIHLLTLSVLTFLFLCRGVKLFFNENKRKLGNALSAWRNLRVDLTWRMGNICQFSYGFCKNCQGHTFCSSYQFSNDRTKKDFHVKNRKQMVLHGFSLQH